MGSEHIQKLEFNILPVPKAVANFTFFPISGVAPLTISTINKSVNAKKYQWNWGDGTSESIDREPTHTYKRAGEYTITLTILGEDGGVVCEKTKINVSYPAPTAGFSVSDCVSVGVGAEFSNASLNATRWLWDFGDGSELSTEKNPVHKFARSGNYKVVLQAFNPDGVSATNEITVEVGEKLEVGFEWETSSSDSRSISFKNTSKGATRYYWDFGDGDTSTEKSPSHTFFANETKGVVVTLTAFNENGLQIKKSERITISVDKSDTGTLNADFTYAQQTNTTAATVKFTNTSVGGVKYSWDFGDGTTSTEVNPTHIYNVEEEQNVNVSLVAFAADGSESKKVTVIKIIPSSSGASLGKFLVIILVVAVIGVCVAIKIFKKTKTFTVTLFSKDNKPVGKKVVKVGEIVSITSLNGGSDLDFQIVNAVDDSRDDFKVRFRKVDGSSSILKQKSLKLCLTEQWGEAVDMSNLTVDSGRLVFDEGDNEEGEE